jgi:site-specific recombinase XerD
MMPGVDGSGLGGCCPMPWLDRSPSSDTYRHGFTRHRLAQGADIRTIQGLLEHSDVKAKMVDAPVLNRRPIW